MMNHSKIPYSPYRISFNKIKFKDETWSYIAPTWIDMEHIYLNLCAKILADHTDYDILITLANGGWTWARTMADILDIKNMDGFKLTMYNPIHPGIKLEKPILEKPLNALLEGKKTILFDDVDDTGESMEWSLDYLRHFRPKSITTATLFHKPHSRFNPDYFGTETDAWIVFPHEHREAIAGLAKKWKTKGISEKDIIKRLKDIGLPEKEINLFISLENLT